MPGKRASARPPPTKAGRKARNSTHASTTSKSKPSKSLKQAQKARDATTRQGMDNNHNDLDAVRSALAPTHTNDPKPLVEKRQESDELKHRGDGLAGVMKALEMA